MDCQDCCQQEEYRQQQIVRSNQALQYRGWLGHSRSYQNFTNYARPEQSKVSLKRKNKQRLTEVAQFQPQLKTDSVKTMQQRIIHKNSSYGNITYRPNSYIAQPNMIQPVSQYHPSIHFTHMPILRESLPAQLRTVTERPRTSLMVTQSLNHQKMMRPLINITYDQKNETKTVNLQNLPLTQVQPLKVEFESCPSPTSAQKDSQKIQKMAETNNVNGDQNPRPSQMFSLENEAARSILAYEIEPPVRKSSIQFRNNNMEGIGQATQIYNPASNLMPSSLNIKANSNRGKLSHIQVKKLMSYDNGEQHDVNKSTGMIKSLRITQQHLDEIDCKKTQSIADANDDSESSKQSLVIMDMNDIRLKAAGNKMTTSDIKPTTGGTPSNKIIASPKRSIIWETSRKQSYSEL